MDCGRGMFFGKHMSSLTRFCFTCGRCSEFLNDADQTETSDILHQCVQYFNEGHSYAVIVDMMSSLHGVNISLGTLKSKLNEAGLYRRKDYSSPNSVSNAIIDYYSGASSHMYGSSINNQRIESWWSIFRKGR